MSESMNMFNVHLYTSMKMSQWNPLFCTINNTNKYDKLKEIKKNVVWVDGILKQEVFLEREYGYPMRMDFKSADRGKQKIFQISFA
jgi:hypothetical protein